jgi:UDP-glucose 4-epimerase
MIAVLGAGGFLGSHLVESLSRLGAPTLAAGRFDSVPRNPIPGNTRKLAISSLEHFQRVDGCRGLSKIVCLVGPPGPGATEAWSAATTEAYLADFFSFLEHCTKYDLEHFYFASSGGTVYGEGADSGHSETDPLLPVGNYGRVMVSIENRLEKLREDGRLNSTIFRIANPYGPRQRADKGHGFLSVALRNVLEGRPVQIVDDGEPVRDFIYVGDTVDIMARIVTNSHKHALYNLGSGISVSLNHVVEKIEEVLGKKVLRQPIEAPPNLVRASILNISRLKSELQPLVFKPIEEGILDTSKYLMAEKTSMFKT